ncbi:MAG: glycosyl hydrolase family 18 protein [Treponema sp.]|nr:glycosyl hydrolase family 18 protein [Treponema sp.]
MKQFLILMLIAVFLGCTGSPNNNEEDEEEGETALTDEELAAFFPAPGGLPVTSFKEVWGYVIDGQEAALRRGLPITDVGYFGAEVDMYGALSKVPNRQNLGSFPGRVHLVVTCGSNPLTYFTLMPGSPQRAALITDLIAATRNFDGLNIDFENIPPRSGEPFLSFLRELKEGLPPNKILSVCLYGRTRTLQNDVYDYTKIAPLADKIFVMAYDEHWGGGPAGPVSTIRWCRSAAEYSLRTVGAEKLVMGIPFYGRAWANQNHHRALIFSTTERLINTYNATVRRENGTPTFDYNVTIGVKVYYEDEYSISARMVMYKSMGINSIGFWRIGQETPRVWGLIRIE